MPRAYQETAADSSRAARLDVRKPVANQERRCRIEVERLDGPVEHPGPRLAAIAVDSIALQGRIGEVRAVLDGVEPHAARPQTLSHVGGQCQVLRLWVETARDTRLIRDDHQRVA